MFKNALRKVFANGSVRLGGGVLLLLILMSIFGVVCSIWGGVLVKENK